MNGIVIKIWWTTSRKSSTLLSQSNILKYTILEILGLSESNILIYITLYILNLCKSIFTILYNLFNIICICYIEDFLPFLLKMIVVFLESCSHMPLLYYGHMWKILVIFLKYYKKKYFIKKIINFFYKTQKDYWNI